MIDCSEVHSLCVSVIGDIWWSGCNPLGDKQIMWSDKFRQFYTSVDDTSDYDGSKFVSVSTSHKKSMALTEKGIAYIFYNFGFFAIPHKVEKMYGTYFKNEKLIGAYTVISEQLVLAFAMGTHWRLGSSMHDLEQKSCAFFELPSDLLKSLIELGNVVPVKHNRGIELLLGAVCHE